MLHESGPRYLVRRLPLWALLVILGVALTLPCAAPFATASLTSSTTKKQASPSNIVDGHESPISNRPTTSSTLYNTQHMARHMATANIVNGDAGISSRKRYSMRKFVDLVRGKGRGRDKWKGGEGAASLPSRLLFQYATPLLNEASKRRLQPEDAFEISQDRQMSTAVQTLTTIFESMREKSKRKIEQDRQVGSKKLKASQTMLLTRALMVHQRKMLFWTGSLRLCNTLVQAFPSILLARLLRLVEAGDAYPVSKALTAAAQLVSVLLAKMLLENQFFHHVVKCSTEVRGALSGLIFDKSLRLPGGGSSVTHTTDKGKGKKDAALGAGGVLNLMQSDTSILEGATMQIHTIWDGPLQIAIYTTLLFRYLGPSVLYGIAVLLLTIPLNSVTLRYLNKLSKYENEAKDARTKRTSESIANMKLLKLQGWENRFADDIREHRSDELQRHATRGLVKALNSAISNSVPALVLVVTLTAYVKTGRPIVASTIFTAISLFNQLRLPLFFFPLLIDSLANGLNAMRRISSYLSSEEIVPYVENLPPSQSGGGSVKLTNGNFLWTNTKPPKDGEIAGPSVPALYNANLDIQPGEVVAVVGAVGSGKSALIKSLLGELVPVPKTVVHSSISQTSESSPAEAQETNTPDSIDKPSVVMQGNIAYCSQEAWLPKGTIREAVVFGREYDENRYLAAIRDAGLDGDIVDASWGATSKADASSGLLSHETQVGEGGSSLSGGQRARVALARALYAEEDTKVFLLDDCLAALDATVGSTVFERVTARLKKSGAATILVTNDPNLPRRCDRVVLMQKVPSSSSCSTIADVGSYDELIRRGHSLQSIAAEDIEGDEEHTRDAEAPGDETTNGSRGVREIDYDVEFSAGVNGQYGVPSNSTDCRHADPDSLETCPEFITGSHRLSTEKAGISEEGEDSGDSDEKISITTGMALAEDGEEENTAEADTSETAEKREVIAKKPLSTDDTMEAGAVPRSAYMTYLKSVRKPLLIMAMLSAYLMANGAQFFQQFIVAKWTELGSDSIAAALSAKYLRSLVNAAGVVSVCLWVRSYLTMKVGVRASEFLHSRMLSSVFSAPTSFFDATPSGQLLARFGKEMETIDRSLPDSFGSVLFCFLQIFMSGAALAGIVTPAMLIPITAVGVMYVKTMSKFRPGARDLKRIETKTRSPIFTHFGEALRGTEIIRSIPGARGYWSATHRGLTDTNLRTFFSVKNLDRWLSCRLEGLGNVVVFSAAVLSVLLTRTGRLKSGSAGWALTQSLAITGLMTWAVRCLTDLETNMMSLVRVKELTDLDSEEMNLDKVQSNKSSLKKRVMAKEFAGAGEALKPLLGQSSNITLAPITDDGLSGWPWQGDVQFRNVSMRYNEYSDLVLKGIDLNVPSGTTLGVVGRTGSGKSSLLLTLFRLVEVEAGGQIEIDSVDIRSLSLQKLRESLAIIPQDPVLFAGSVAYNLDATGKSSPEEMWDALQAASPSLAEQFKQSRGLETTISEGGKNLSQGQRQLLCLARALLRRSRVLVLDEATASVDPNTDRQVQATIRREFVNKGVTVITVAHRLETVLGYDKIAVLGDGKVLEYGTPKDLLKNRDGELRRLVDADRLSKKKGAKKNSNEIPIPV